jgi:hypothetical protein
VGWFGRKPKIAVEDVGTALFWQATEALTPMLAARGYDIKGDDILRSRAGKVVAPACNVAPDEAAQLAKNIDQLMAKARNIAATAEPRFLDELARRPAPPPDATGEQRYGPNWEAVESFIESLSGWLPPEEWQGIIGGVLSLRAGPPHPAKEHMKNLKAQAVYAAGQKGRELGLDDQIAFAQADAGAAVQYAAGEVTFLEACQALGVTRTQAAGPVSLEATNAAEALVIGSDNLETQFYAALASTYIKQRLGADVYERESEDFRKASEDLGQT